MPTYRKLLIKLNLINISFPEARLDGPKTFNRDSLNLGIEIGKSKEKIPSSEVLSIIITFKIRLFFQHAQLMSNNKAYKYNYSLVSVHISQVKFSHL